MPVHDSGPPHVLGEPDRRATLLARIRNRVGDQTFDAYLLVVSLIAEADHNWAHPDEQFAPPGVLYRLARYEAALREIDALMKHLRE